MSGISSSLQVHPDIGTTFPRVRVPRPSVLGSLTLPCGTSRSRAITPPGGRHRRTTRHRQGSVFQHFGSKDGLFFEVYKKP